MVDVALARCPSYTEELCRAALELTISQVGGLDWVRPGMRIGIKANLVSAMKPDRAATTHPVLLGALVKLLQERGAEVIVGDSPGGLYTAAHLNRVYAVTGMEQTGAVLNRDFRTAEAEFPQAAVAKRFTVTRWLLDCDEIVNFCKLKSHGMMGMSAAAKNMFGTIPGTMKPEYHYRYPDKMDFARMLVDLDEYWKPRLHIVDAVVGMEGNGPTAGTPKPVGCVLAGTNPHRVDLLCAKLIGLAPESLPLLCAAAERELTGLDVEQLKIAGDWKACVQTDFQTVEERTGLQFQNLLPGRAGKLLSAAVGKCIEPRPGVKKDECIGCGKCGQICPAKAIKMKSKLPRIDRKRCIRCFCCQEFCPKGAMKVRRRPLASLLMR